MRYEELDPKQKQHVNGVVAQFMDSYIRNHLTWTPEQMYEALFEMVDEQHRNGWYGGLSYIDGEYVEEYTVGSAWITSEDAREYILEKFQKKYQKNKKLARKDSPLIERARFGIKKDSGRFFDINYGLKLGSCFERTEIVENTTIIPWSIEHVEYELKSKYGIDLKMAFDLLSTSPIETKFCEYWFEHYYCDKRNPAIIPEFCGDRKLYYCYKDKAGNYTMDYDKDYKAVNVRFDFAVINYTRQKMLLIELDGHDYHKTKDQRLNDSVKRAVATNNGWQLNVITGTQIHNDVASAFAMMEDFFLRK